MSLLAGTMAQAQDIYMKVTLNNSNQVITSNTTFAGTVRDNNTNVNLSDYSEISSLQYDLEQSLNLGSQTGAGAGKIAFNPITITKFTDASSARLMQACAQGETFKIEFLFVSGIDGKTRGVSYKMRTTVAAVKTFSGSASNGECSTCAGLAESFTFEYVNLEVFTYKQAQDGTLQSSGKFGWDRFNNKSIN